MTSDPTTLLGLPVDETLKRLGSIGATECEPPIDPNDPFRTRHAIVLGRGLSVVIQSNVTTAVQIHGDGSDGLGSWRGPLPGGLDFPMGRDSVRALLGRPLRTGGSQVLPILGPMPPWDAFDGIHVEYDDDGATRIRMVTLTPPADDQRHLDGGARTVTGLGDASQPA